MMDVINSKEYIASKTKIPQYLQDFLEENQDVTLVFQKAPLLSLTCATTDVVDTLSSTFNTSLNLTGCPLEIDLNITPNSIICEPVACNKNDETFKPMTIKAARRFNNNYIRQLRSDPAKPLGVYSVCNGLDDKNTVVLGSCMATDSVLSRILICACGSIEEFCNQTTMDHILNHHKSNAEDGSSNMKTEVTSFYDVHGCKLEPLHNFQTTYNSGYIGIEAQWNTTEFNIPERGAVVNMFLQAVIGHENSLLYDLYKKLIVIQNCTKVLKDGNFNDDTHVNNLFNDSGELLSKITNALNEIFCIKATAIPQDMEQALANFTEYNVTDRLWNIFLCSNNLGSLRNAINSLFSTIGSETIRVQILDDDLTTSLGNIIKNIYDGKMLVPTLTLKQSLILFIELGLQKIWKVLTFIVKAYDVTTSHNINQQWSKLKSNTGKSKDIILDHFNSEIISISLDFLYSVYTTLEFLRLVEENCAFTKEFSTSVMVHAYNKYVTCREHLNCNSSKQILELMVPVVYNDVKLATDCPPLKWKIKISSVKRYPLYNSVTTLFHFSQNPIFPESIYKYKDADIVDDGQRYFITRMEMFSDKLPI